MARTTRTTAAALLAWSLAGTALTPALAQDETWSAKVIGSAAYRERIAIGSDAELVVELREMGALDPAVDAGSVRLLAENRQKLEGRQVPLPFYLKAEGASLVPGTSYALRLQLTNGDGPGWVSAPIAVEIPQAATGKVEIEAGNVLLVRSLPVQTTARLACGDETGRLQHKGEIAVLDFGGQTLALRQTPAASGVRYEAADDATTVLWTKGPEASFTLRGQEQPPCTLEIEAPEIASGLDTLPGGEWVVEGISSSGIIDNSRVTLIFAADGQLSGRATCNSYGTRFATNGDRIAIDPRAISTMMGCAPALMNQERKFLDTLPKLTGWRIDETGALLLEGSDGALVKARRDG
ncbi:META domain-containing protein [Stappia sp. 28M-7]|uniref:META domain-containing protein n=1 Tax=Stappia sp. 28M-7 TaxID=2762596 RepID=UPI00163CABA5|nr:META domain-containing protein [Stappia sp. 28M-7]MBC2859018.1 META domain-containing protein [Stappia sp. 28M-7]